MIDQIKLMVLNLVIQVDKNKSIHIILHIIYNMMELINNEPK
jgi:hypothetical protein